MLNFIKKFKRGDKINEVLGVDNLRRICNILEDIEGQGLKIDKPVDNDGHGWKIIFDGKQSDTDTDTDGADDLTFIVLPIDVWTDGQEKHAKGDAQANAGEDWEDLTPYVPIGKEYLNLYNPSLASIKNSNNDREWHDNLSITVQDVDGEEIWKLGHGNQYAAWARAGYNINCLTIAWEADHYRCYPWILRKWNDNDYLTPQSKSALLNLAFMVLDEYIPKDEPDAQSYREQHPYETRFVQADNNWFDTLVHEVLNEYWETLLDLICEFIEGSFPYQRYCGMFPVTVPGRLDPGVTVTSNNNPHSNTAGSAGMYGHDENWIDVDSTNWLQRSDFEAISIPVADWKDKIDDENDVFQKFYTANAEIDNRIAALESKIAALESFYNGTFTSVKNAYDQLVSDIGTAESNVTALQTRATALQTRINDYTS